MAYTAAMNGGHEQCSWYTAYTEEREMKKLYKSETNRMIAGVCGGIAEYFETDATLVRLGFVAFSLLGGSGVLAYLIAAIVIPGRNDLSTRQEGL